MTTTRLGLFPESGGSGGGRTLETAIETDDSDDDDDVQVLDNVSSSSSCARSCGCRDATPDKSWLERNASGHVYAQ